MYAHTEFIVRIPGNREDMIYKGDNHMNVIISEHPSLII